MVRCMIRLLSHLGSEHTMPVDLSRAQPGALPVGSVEFILIFTRAEFALKQARLLLTPNGLAQPSWNAFADALGNAFWQHVRNSGNANTLINARPHAQFAHNNVVNWEIIDQVVDARSLFVAVKTVRNNLVHGGKHFMPDDPPDDPERNGRLIAEARWVLLQALERHDEVRAAFEGHA